MTIKNMTPHRITILCGRGEQGFEEMMILDPVGPAPRLSVEREDWGALVTEERQQIPVVRTRMGAVEGLPPPEEGTWLVVSALVAEASAGREDLLYPGEAVRDTAGVIVGCRGLCAGPGVARLREGDARGAGNPGLIVRALALREREEQALRDLREEEDDVD